MKNFIKEPSTTWLFAKNQYYAMQDVGLHIKGTELRDKSKQTAKATTVLASLTPEIFNHLETKKPLLLQSDKNLADAIYTFLGPEKDVEETEAVINNLKSIAGDDLLDHQFLSTEEISKRGYVLLIIFKRKVQILMFSVFICKIIFYLPSKFDKNTKLQFFCNP